MCSVLKVLGGIAGNGMDRSRHDGKTQKSPKTFGEEALAKFILARAKTDRSLAEMIVVVECCLSLIHI